MQILANTSIRRLDRGQSEVDQPPGFRSIGCASARHEPATPTWGGVSKGLGMKGLVAIIGALLLILASSQPPANALTPQQELMKTCNAQAGNQKLTGDARKSFMSDCLSGKTSSGLTRQQELMKSCNVQANSQKLKGDARKQFMSTCLKG